VEHERVPESIDLILSDADYKYPIILEPGWELLGFLETMGADEFTLRFLFEGGDPKKGAVPVFVREPGSVAQAHSVGRAHSDALFARLEEYYLGERERETGTGIGHVVGYELQISREIGTWRFDEESRRALKVVLPLGVTKELYARAQEADLPGRSEMSKDQLVEALRSRELNENALSAKTLPRLQCG
jgi:hypothetical protein